MTSYYGEKPNVTVILDRRAGPDRRRGKAYGGLRAIRDAAGTGYRHVPKTDVA